MDLPKSLEEAVDEFMEAWDRFLLDEINTEQVTDYIIRMLRVRESLESPQDPYIDLFED